MDDEQKETETDDEPKQTRENKIRQSQPRNQISSEVNSAECPECPEVFTSEGTMRTHYRSVHQGINYNFKSEEIKKEDITEEIVMDYEDLEPKPTSEIKTRQRQPRNQIPDDKSSVCQECGKVFSSKCHMVRHYRHKHEGKRYPCNQCDYQATAKESFRVHIEGKHTDNILMCELCNYVTKWKNNLKSHMKAHTTI